MRKIILLIAVIITLNLYFTIKTDAAEETTPPELVSNAAVMIDSETGTVLYGKNSNKKMYPASLTKIATAIYAIETGNLNDIVTVSENARNTEGTKVYLEGGEKVKLKKLIQGLLINSGNDAGIAIAEHLNGSVERFSNEINTYLKNEIGVKNTHFANPHGLFNPNHVTTAKDLAMITQYAVKNATFQEIFGTVELEWHGETWDTTLLTHHKLMRQMPYEGITGGKTGFVNQSGFTLATTVKRDDLSVIVITLNSNVKSASYKDTINLLDYGFENFKKSIIPKGKTFKAGVQEYVTSEKITYTHRLNEQIRKEMNDNGLLKIVSQNGSTISSYRLTKVKKEKIKEIKTVHKDVKTNSMFGDYVPTLVATLIIIVMGLLVLFYRRLRNIR